MSRVALLDRPVVLPAIDHLVSLVSVPAERVRARLHQRGLVYRAHPDASDPPVDTLRHVALRVAASGEREAIGLATLGALGGVFTFASGQIVSLIHHLRLTQRIAVVFGYDPATPRGRAAVTQAFAVGYGISGQSGAHLRIRDLPLLLTGPTPEPVSAMDDVAQKGAAMVLAKAARTVPLAGVAVAAADSARRTRGSVRRMIEAFVAGLPHLDAIEAKP